MTDVYECCCRMTYELNSARCLWQNSEKNILRQYTLSGQMWDIHSQCARVKSNPFACFRLWSMTIALGTKIHLSATCSTLKRTQMFQFLCHKNRYAINVRRYGSNQSLVLYYEAQRSNLSTCWVKLAHSTEFLHTATSINACQLSWNRAAAVLHWSAAATPYSWREAATGKVSLLHW